MTDIWAYGNSLTSFDWLDVPLLTKLHIYSNQLNTIQLNKIIIDADASGLSNGNLKILDNAGAITEDVLTEYNSLIGKGWTIDVPAPSGGADSQAPTWSGSNLTVPSNVSQTTLTLNWTAATDNVAVTNYKVYQDAVEIIELGTQLTYNVTGLTANTNYDFVVTALDIVGNESVDSNTRNVTTASSADTTDPTIGTLTYANETHNSVELSVTATDNVGVTGFDIYINSVFNNAVSGSSLSSYVLSGLSPNTSYNVDVKSKDLAGNESPISNTVSFTTNTAPVFAGTNPKIDNFRINDTNKDRVYFDAYGDISALNTTGFTISGKTISAVNTTNNYFTVSSAFNFWDNNTIRLVSGNGTVYDFDMQYIDNNIAEPTASTNRYVSTTATGAGNGQSIGSPWTLSQAGSATAGMTVWIKAGDYGNATLNPSNSGSSGSPIKFIGYTTTIGDDPDVGWVYPSNINPKPSIMPFLDGTGSNHGITIGGNYIIFRNLWIDGYNDGIRGGSSSYIMIDNVITANAGGNSDANISFENDGANNVRIINSVGYNGGTQNYQVYGSFNLIDNCQVIAGTTGNDYFIVARGNNSIFRNCYVERFVGHSGHGLCLKSVGVQTEYNLWENIEVGGIKSSMEARHDEVQHNVWRNIYVWENGYGGAQGTGGIHFLNGASYNIFDNIRVDGTTAFGVRTGASSEDPTATSQGHDNIVKNSSFYTLGTATAGDGVYYGTDSDGQNRVWRDNKFINCNWYGNKDFIENATSSTNEEDNEFINCTITNTVSKLESTSSIFTNCNFYNNGHSTPSGTNITTLNPQFVDALNGDFHLQATSGIRGIGANNSSVHYDADGVERIDGDYSIGAYEFDAEADYYFSATGDDVTGDGSLATPWKTTTKFNTESASFNDKTVAFKGGDEFYGGISLTSEDNVTIKSYGTGKAILKGHKGYNSWTSEGGNIYSATVSGSDFIYQTFEGDAVLQQARYPKIDGELSTEDNYYSVTSTSSSTKFICSDLIGFPNIVGASVQINGNEWDTNSRTITAFTSGTGEVTLSSSIDGGLSSGDLFWVTNDYDLLDADGEWYFDDSADKLYIYDTGGTPTNIKGQTFDGSAITLTTSDNVTVENITIKNYNTHGIYFNDSDNGIVDGVDFLYNYTTGVFTHISLATTVRNSYFKGCMENAINLNNNQLYTYTSNGVVTGNTIFEHGLLKQATNVQYNIPHAIRLQGSTHTMTYNDIQKIGGNGVRIYGRDTDVMYNYIKDSQLTNHDQGAIYSQGGNDKDNNQVQNMNVQYNIIENTYTAGNGWLAYGIYIDDNSTNSIVDKNTVIGGVNGIFLHNTKDVDVTDNNLYNQSLESLIMIEGSQWGSIAMTGNSMTNNDVLNNNANEALFVRNTRSGAASYNFGDLDYNNYWNTGNTDDVHHNTTQESENTYTLSAWASKYTTEMGTTQEANSTSDLGETVSDRQIVTNLTDSAVNKSISGTWYDLDGNSYSGSITLQPYTSEILIQQ